MRSCASDTQTLQWTLRTVLLRHSRRYHCPCPPGRPAGAGVLFQSQCNKRQMSSVFVAEGRCCPGGVLHNQISPFGSRAGQRSRYLRPAGTDELLPCHRQFRKYIFSIADVESVSHIAARALSELLSQRLNGSNSKKKLKQQNILLFIKFLFNILNWIFRLHFHYSYPLHIC